MCSLVTLSKYYSTMSKTLLAESFGQRLLVILTALSPFYVTRYGCRLLDNAGAYCPEKPHDKSSVLYKYPTNRCKNNLESSTGPKHY
ncbi:hypothetical protein [Colwellia psychrerythraea]|uniref:hypothetical protein n=1 Tax=Colwellia psychrerythraea TaxID=28229 RepID=UPI0009DEA27A|nr:hypothetical protein [Colwellia psychrerythraea]